MILYTSEYEEIKAIEALMLEKFRSEPFHNLKLLYGSKIKVDLPGGTCSDKTLSFLSAAKKSGFDASLHSGSIGGKEIHRLAKIDLSNRRFFADVGNGWPSLRLYPAYEAISFECFGMRFRTEISGSVLSVYHLKQGKEALQLEIDVRDQPEDKIKADIEARFNSGIIYPFSSSIRLSQIIEDDFLFLRGERLEIYSNDERKIIEGINDLNFHQIVKKHFGYDVFSRF